jgi:peptidoglycan/LPS O-acetylase OafA/YrhL
MDRNLSTIKKEKNTTIHSLQYLRAIAALLVVLHHSIWKSTQYGGSDSVMSWFTIGFIGVDIFFIISGFIISQIIYIKNINIFNFLKARLLRIIPLYWILTTVALVVFIIMPDKVNSSGGETNILYSYLLFPDSSKFLIQNGWTLSYEFYFYFIISIGLLFSNKLKFIIPLSIIIFIVLFGSIYKQETVLYAFLTNSLLIEFLLGMLIFKIIKFIPSHQAISVLYFFTAILILLYVEIYNGIGIRFIDYGIPSLLIFISIFNLEEKIKCQKDSILGQIMMKIGNSSYSLYLIHPFILTLMSIILSKIGLNEFGYLFILILISTSVFAGYLCYKYLEMPMQIYWKRYK